MDKLWGETESLDSSNTSQLCRIRIDLGGYCSWHLHEHKWNMFVVVSGKIMVFSNSEDSINYKTLLPNDSYSVSPNVKHKFLALEETTAYEFYWGDKVSCDDIVRFSDGGCLC